jgi:hypothetical protein
MALLVCSVPLSLTMVVGSPSSWELARDLDAGDPLDVFRRAASYVDRHPQERQARGLAYTGAHEVFK